MQKISSKELSEWRAYQSLYGPIGPEREDLRSAQVVQALARILGGSEADLTDFTLRWTEAELDPEDLSDEERSAKVIELYNRTHGITRR